MSKHSFNVFIDLKTFVVKLPASNQLDTTQFEVCMTLTAKENDSF